MGTTILEEIYTFLKTQTALTALVQHRMYPNTLPQDCELPALTYEITNETSVHTMSKDTSNPRRPLVTFHVWGEEYADAQAVAIQIITALKDKTGALTSRSLQRVFMDNQYDLYESDTGTHHIVLDFIVWYT